MMTAPKGPMPTPLDEFIELLQIKAANPTYFHVVCVPDGAPVEVTQHATEEDLKDQILSLRTRQNENTSVNLHVFIFEGHQWLIQKGPAWQVTDGVRAVVLEQPPAVTLCLDGALREAKAPELVLPLPIVDAPAVPAVLQSAVPTFADDSDDELVAGPDGSEDVEIG